VISGNYFRTLGLPSLKGRELGDDDRQGATRAAVVNVRFAEEFFPASDPIGRRLLIAEHRTSGGTEVASALEIVGIVKDLKSSGLNEPIQPQIFASYLQAPTASEYLVVRSTVAPQQIVGPVREAVRSLDADLPLSNVSTMDERLAQALVGGRVVVSLMVIFAFVALVMGGAGLYGVVSYSTSQRMTEFAVRLALGASRREIFRLITKSALRLLLIGGGIGALLVLGMTRLLSRMIFGISPYDPITLMTVSLVLLAVVLAASFVPARRAMKADPLVVLRYE
jgi:putative ABC transport system permease protein